MKTCTICHSEQPINAYYKHPGSKDGYATYCKKCYLEKSHKHYSTAKYREWHRDNARKNRLSNPERYREMKRKWYWKNRASIDQSKLSSKQRFARIEIQNAVNNGTIIKPKICQICGKKSDKIQSHHPDYNKPLSVIWVCIRCHSDFHIIQ